MGINELTKLIEKQIDYAENQRERTRNDTSREHWQGYYKGLEWVLEQIREAGMPDDSQSAKSNILPAQPLTTVEQRVKDLVKQFGSFRKAGKELGMMYTHLFKLQTGERIATAETLQRLGLKKDAHYGLAIVPHDV